MERNFYMGAIPATVDVAEIDEVAVEDMFMASCGVVSYRLASSASERLAGQGLRSLTAASSGRTPERSRLFRDYSWRATHAGADALASLAHLNWSSGFGCGGDRAAAWYPVVEEALTSAGSFFVVGDRHILILIPSRRRAVLSFVLG